MKLSPLRRKVANSRRGEGMVDIAGEKGGGKYMYSCSK